MSLRPFTIRLPEDLIDKLEERCAQNRRKRNDEITAILEKELLGKSDPLTVSSSK